MPMRHMVLGVLALLLAVVGYFFFAIVVAIHVGLWLHDEKMYYAQSPSCHFFGAAGAALGVLLACLIWRLALALAGRGPQAPPTQTPSRSTQS